ncbi:MAG: ABC-type branched-subunit amino acid transport system substrate-binding protein [Acidimicrobiales bacterium]|jgi:ABC-type branched-subunit amino acid transport system substrate-binding protein
MKKPFKILGTLLAMCLVAAACGSDSDSSDGGAATTEAPDTTEVDDTAEADDTADTTEAADPDAGSGGDGAMGTEETLVIGYVLPQTGALSAIIDALVKPSEMAVEEINAAGGNVSLIPGDSGTDVNIASATVDALINDDVSVILGPAGTSVTLGVIDKITGSGIVECSGSTTGSVFSTYDDGGFYFRTSPPDSIQGPVLADLMTDDGVSSVGVIYRNDEYGVGFNESLVAGLEANGVTVAAQVALDPSATSFDAEIGEIAAAGVDSIVLITFAEGAAVMQGMIEAGVGPDDVAVYVTDGFKDAVTAEGVNPDDLSVLEGVRGTAPSAAPADGEPGFLDRLEAFAPGTPTIFSGHFYDCVNVMALAALAAGSIDSADIVGEMLTVTNDGEECISYEACATILAAGGDINYQGASGLVDLNDVGEPTSGAYDIYTYDAEGTAVTEDQISLTIG